MLETAIKQIAQMQPSALPRVDLPQLPDLSAVGPLAEIAHGDPSKLLDAAGVAEADQKTIAQVLERAEELLRAAGRDLLGIGLELIQKGLPLALGLLIPNPAAQAAARTALQALAMQHLAKAVARVKQLAGELLAAAQPLIPIAQRAVASSVNGPQQARHALEAAPVMHAVSDEATVKIGASESSVGAGSGAGKKAVDAALSKVGTPYVWGGTGNGGFDCSGLTQWAWRQAGVELPRTAEMQTVGRQVTADTLQPGDLIVWDGHVAMYSGGGQMVEAGSPVQTNPLRTTNMGMAFKGFWRPTG